MATRGAAPYCGNDDLHISPFRDDGVTYGTPTWICRLSPMMAWRPPTFAGRAAHQRRPSLPRDETADARHDLRQRVHVGVGGLIVHDAGSQRVTARHDGV